MAAWSYLLRVFQEHNQRIGLCKNSLKYPPDDGRITAEIRIGASL
jgi:hypothetical protein